MKTIIILLVSYLFFSCTSKTERTNDLFNEIIEAKHQVIQDTIFENIRSEFDTNIVQIRIEKKCGLYNKKLKKQITPLKYDEIGYFGGEQTIDFRIGEKYGFLNSEGLEIIPGKYQFVSGFCNGLAAIKLDNKWGYVDKNNKIVVPIQFDMAWTFHLKDRGAVQKDGKWGFINSKGEYVIEPIYDNVTRAFDTETKVANVSIKSHHFFIDTKGKFLADSQPYKKWGE
jgi:hypothetical protein